MSPSPWHREFDIDTPAPPEAVWQHLADVDLWSDWNAGVEAIQLHGPFAEGSTFTMKTPGMPAFTSLLRRVRPGEGFEDETVLGELCVRVDHRLARRPDGGTRITYAATVEGPDAEAAGEAITADFADVLAALSLRAQGFQGR